MPRMPERSEGKLRTERFVGVDESEEIRTKDSYDADKPRFLATAGYEKKDDEAMRGRASAYVVALRERLTGKLGRSE